MRSLQAEESGQSFLRAAPISLTTPSNNLRIIQEIQFSPSSPRPNTRPSQLPRLPKQQQNPAAIRFNDNPLVAVLGRQVKGSPVEGFPNGLPDFTPKGVRITLENMIGMKIEIANQLFLFFVQVQMERW